MSATHDFPSALVPAAMPPIGWRAWLAAWLARMEVRRRQRTEEWASLRLAELLDRDSQAGRSHDDRVWGADRLFWR